MNHNKVIFTLILSASLTKITFAQESSVLNAIEKIALNETQSLMEFSPKDSRKIYNYIKVKPSPIGENLNSSSNILYKGNSKAFCITQKKGALRSSDYSCFMNKDYLEEVFSNSDSKRELELSPTDHKAIQSVVLEDDYYSSYQFSKTEIEETSGDILDILERSTTARIKRKAGYASTEAFYGNENAECKVETDSEHGHNQLVICGFNFHSLQGIFSHEQLDTINGDSFNFNQDKDQENTLSTIKVKQATTSHSR